MRIERVKNFISSAECDALNAWVDEAASKNWMLPKVISERSRLTTRICGDRFEYPPLVLDIRDRIVEAMGLEKFPLILDQGRDGVVVSRADIGSAVHEHVDATSPIEDLRTFRCNILTRKSNKGGELVLKDKILDIEVGELHCYMASEHRHRVSVVEDGPSRVLWMFGAYVPSGFWE